METTEKNELVFSITLQDLQYESLERIGRILTEQEIHVAKKGLEAGLLTDIDTVYGAIFSEMIEN
jgi:hypothetical protein